MNTDYSEDRLVEQPTIELFSELEYETALSSQGFFHKKTETVVCGGTFWWGLVAGCGGIGSIAGTGGTSGSKPKGRTRCRVELFTFPEQLPGPARFGKGLGVSALPQCSTEPFQNKALRFTDDPTLIGDELRILLREVRKCYYQHDHPNVNEDWALEQAYDEWQAFGCNEWFQPIPELEPQVFDELAGWAVRFQRAARIAVTRKLSGVSPALDIESIGKLARCVTPGWCQQTGNELMRAHADLTAHVEVFTHAVDDWVFSNSQSPVENDAPAPLVESNTGVAGRVVRYFQDVNAAVADWRDLLRQFENTFDLLGGPQWSDIEEELDETPYYYSLADTSGKTLLGCSLANEIREFSRATQRVGKYGTSGRSERIDAQLLEDWAHEIEFAFAFERNSENLVGLTFRVRKAFEQFLEEAQCDAAVAAVDTPKVGPAKTDEQQDNPPEPLIDGPDPTRMILILGGHEFGPFTPTQFDVVQVMWENRESTWPESNAFFTFHQKLGWPQTDGGPFGKHQTTIQSVFEGKGFGLPWKRIRGAFVWCGLVPPKAKRTPKPKVRRSKNR